MSCHDCRLLIDALVDGELAGAEKARLEGHLGTCPACARSLEERRGLSSFLQDSLRRGLEGVRPPAGERERLAARMASSRPRPARLVLGMAAAVLVGLAAGFVAHGLLREPYGPPTPEERALARGLEELERRRALVGRLGEEARQDLEAVRASGAFGPADHAPLLAVSLERAEIERGLAPEDPAERPVSQLVADTASREVRVRGAAYALLRALPPERLEDLRKATESVAIYDRAFVSQVIAHLEDRRADAAVLAIEQSVPGGMLHLKQFSDGRIQLTLPGRAVEARDMDDLQSRHADLCRQYGIAGRDGAVRVGGRWVGRNLKGQLSLMFRTGGWDEDFKWDAYRSWAAGTGRDVREVEERVKELQERCRRAAESLSLPSVRVDVEEILSRVRGRDAEEIRRIGERVRVELEGVQERLRKAHELRARAKALRVFAESVR